MDLQDTTGTTNKSFYKRNKKKVRRTILLLIVVLAVAGGFIASEKLQGKGYTGLWDFTKTVTSNYWKGLDAQPENVSIGIKEKDYKLLEKNRAKALERGIIINDMDGDYVPAEMQYNGKKIAVKLRLKGHMTDHLQDNKWSFRIKVKDKGGFMGMKRFSIQHPGTRGYIYEWIYHELMKREGLIALRYKFINVTVNGRDWGIYAVEENFENELIGNNGRKRGPILRFNPDLYWVHRYNMMERMSSADEYSSYYSSNPEAYREDDVLADSTQRNYYLKAMAMVEGLRSRKLSVDKVFDIPQLAKFHAIIDLVGGENSIDWSDVKYYYNPVSGRLEPVAYESFTNLESRGLSSLYKYVQLGDSTQNYTDWHTMIFSNEPFFREYIKQLNRMTEQTYFDAFFNESNEELNKNLAIIYKEFPYKKFDNHAYYKRAEMIRKVLDAPKAVHAYLKEFKNDTVHIQVGALDALPVQIREIAINGRDAHVFGNGILPAKQPDTYVNYKEMLFYLPDLKRKELLDSAMITYSVLGSEEIKSIKVFPFPHTDSEFIAKEIERREPNVGKFSFLLGSEKQGKYYTFKTGKITIKEDLIIPANTELRAEPGTILDFVNGAKLISYSSLGFIGSEDQPVIIESSDSTSGGIEVIGAEKSFFSYVTFKNMPEIHDQQWKRSGALTFYDSPVDFANCSFYNSKAEDAVNLIRSPFSFKECLFHKMHDDALDIDYSEGTIANCVFENCRENALDITMGKINITAVYIDGAGNKALNIKAGTQVKGKNLRIKNANIGISAEDLSIVDLQQVTIADSEIGLVAYKNKPEAGHPKMTIAGLKLTKVKTDYLKEKKSTIVANGVAIESQADDVEAIIKSDKKKSK